MTEPAATAIYAVYSNPLPGGEAALHEWYEDVHIPDSFDLGLFESVRRFRAVGESPARFLTLWGCDYLDEEDALSAVRPVAEALRSKGRIEVVQEVVFQQFLFLGKPLGESSAATDGWLMTAHSCWARADTASSFTDWLESGEGQALIEGVDASARYDLKSSRDKMLVLLEYQTSAARDSARRSIAAESGLPPFGPPTPIFVGGSPAPGPPPDPPPSDEQVERWKPAWVACWDPIGERRR